MFNRLTKWFGAAVLTLIAGAAIAQQVLPPMITGTDNSKRQQIVEVGFLKLNDGNVALTALAGGAAAGTTLNVGLNRFTTVATAGDSAQLPTLTGGIVVFVINSTTNSMNVFPNTGGTINALSVNAAFALAAGKSVMFIQASNGAWFANLSS